MTTIDACIPTHYHDDHVAGFSLLQRRYGTKVMCAESFADIISHPADYDLPCLWYDPIKVDQVLPLNQPFMWEEYELTYNSALPLRNEEYEDLGDLKKQISSLKDEIRRLGDVNVNAIEDFKNVSERYEFLKGQHDDLIEAEETLEKIIEELDIAMRKQFAEQFERISKEFDTVFKELFGGGKGTLQLMEDEDILEAGIRIIASRLERNFRI